MPDNKRDTHNGCAVELRKLAESDQPGAIEFALMLDRAIEAFRSDPEMLRGAVYELARTKLKLQLEQSSPEQADEVLKSLEVAIGKVETFSRSQPALLFRPSDLSGSAGASLPPPPPSPSAFGRRGATVGSRKWAGFLIALLIAVGAVTAIFGMRGWFHSSNPAGKQSAVAPIVTNPPEPAPKKRPMPPAYGAYVMTGDAFTELEPVGIRAPDIRVAISPQVKLPERPALTTTRPTFMIYERTPPSVSRAEARAMAKISRVFGGEKADGTWIIRNISTPLRVVMDPDRSDVLVISPNADVELKPGRYALVVGNNAYDFTIPGTPDNTVHCLEQTVATNGTFYSPCK